MSAKIQPVPSPPAGRVPLDRPTGRRFRRHRSGNRAGITGEDGPSHHGRWGLSVLGVVPGLRVAAPRDATRLRVLLREAVGYPGTAVLRFPKGAGGPRPTRVRSRRRRGCPRSIRPRRHAARGHRGVWAGRDRRRCAARRRRHDVTGSTRGGSCLSTRRWCTSPTGSAGLSRWRTTCAGGFGDAVARALGRRRVHGRLAHPRPRCGVRAARAERGPAHGRAGSTWRASSTPSVFAHARPAARRADCLSSS